MKIQVLETPTILEDKQPKKKKEISPERKKQLTRAIEESKREGCC